MRIALLNTKDTPRARYLLDCLAAGMRLHGDTTSQVGPEQLDDLDSVDVVTQICWPNVHHGNTVQGLFRLAAQQRLQQQGKRSLTLDTGFVRCQPDIELSTRDFKINNPSTYKAFDASMYYALGYDGIKRRADYGPARNPDDRWKKLHTPEARWRKTGDHILLIGQTNHGISSQHVNIYSWYKSTLKALREQTARPIVFRVHPRSRLIGAQSGLRKREVERIRSLSEGIRSFSVSQNRRLCDDLENAWAVVTYTSNASVEAIIRGKPVVAMNECNMAWDVASHSVTKIDRIETPARERWLNHLAYCQWNPLEMKNGTAWEYLRPLALLKPESGATS